MLKTCQALLENVTLRYRLWRLPSRIARWGVREIPDGGYSGDSRIVEYGRVGSAGKHPCPAWRQG